MVTEAPSFTAAKAKAEPRAVDLKAFAVGIGDLVGRLVRAHTDQTDAKLTTLEARIAALEAEKGA